MNRAGIVVHVSSGESLSEVIAAAMDLATEASRETATVQFVRFEFNEVTVEVTPHSDPAAILAKFHEVLGTPNAKVGPY